MTTIVDQQMPHLAPCSFIAEQHEQDMLEELDKMHEACHALREDAKASLLSVTHASHGLDCHFEICILRGKWALHHSTWKSFVSNM